MQTSRSRTKQRKSSSRTAIYDKIKVACMPTRPPKRQHFTRSLRNAPNRELSFDRVVSFRYVALHYAAVTTLAGASFFPLYAYAAAEPKELFRWRQAVLLSAAVAALLSGLLLFVFSVANMSGSLTDLADLEVVWAGARDTGFGVVWTARMLLAVIIVGVMATRFCSTATTTHDPITAFLAAVLLASF